MVHSRLNSATLHQADVPVKIPMTYHHVNESQGKPLLLFFHGYTDTGAGFLKRALPDLDSRYEILAPNGLFPTPQKIENGWREAFAWYFADGKNRALIHPGVAASAVEHLVGDLGLTDRPKILLGFSQGGFFLPSVSSRLKNVKKMFAIGSAYRPEDYGETLVAPLDALHGTADEIISLDHAKESFERLKAKNPNGNFFSFEGLKHTMNDPARLMLKEKIVEAFR